MDSFMPPGKPPTGVMLANTLPAIAMELGIGTAVLREQLHAHEEPCLCMDPGCSGVKLVLGLSCHVVRGTLLNVPPSRNPKQ